MFTANGCEGICTVLEAATLLTYCIGDRCVRKATTSFGNLGPIAQLVEQSAHNR